MSTHDIGRVWAARDAAEVIERALRGALPGWDRAVTFSGHHVWTLRSDDGTWTIRASARTPLLLVFAPRSLPGDPLARLNDVSPSTIESVLVALGVPDVGAEVLI